jgi:hypothetical protein|tara:strand:- start:428 stop:841 length:414 start_codon:yes stop_codon:yes gene_type:complete
MSKEIQVVQEQVEVSTVKTSAQVYQETIAAMSLEEKRVIFPPMTKKNFVVRKSWYGRRQIIKFTTKATKTKRAVEVEYDHDIALDIMRPLLETKGAWAKYGYWSQSTNIPLILRHRDLITLETPEAPTKKVTKKTSK